MSMEKALLELVPGAEWIVKNEKLVWLSEDRDQPSEEDIAQKVAELDYIKEVESYRDVRREAYPSSGDQFDKIFHEGIDAWKADIQAIKDAHPKAVIDNDTLEARKSQALFDLQLQKYSNAVERLAQYEVAVGRTEVTETVSTGEVERNEETGELENVTATVVSVSAIDAVAPTVTSLSYDDEGNSTTSEIENPAITKDNEERTQAQAVVDATPSEVIDAYNAL
jgi:hypothetical protein